MRFLIFVSVWCATASLLSVTSGQQWSRFRGPNGTGESQADSIPVEWDDTDINWKVKIPGLGHSSPVVWGDKVFLLSANPNDATRHVLCYRASNGRRLWQRDFKSSEHHLHPRSSFASCTPAVDDQRIYVAWSTPERITFKAFDHNGGEVWDLDLGTWVSQHGFGTSPMLFEDMVIIHLSQQADQLDAGQKPGKSYMVAFDKATGNERWRTPLVSRNVCYSVPFILQRQVGQPELVCTSTGNGVFSLNPYTGEEIWSVVDVFEMRTVASPITAAGLIFGSTGSGRYSSNYVVAVRPGDNSEEVYRLKNSGEFKASYVPSMVTKDGQVYVMYDRGFASCFDAQSGTVHWTERTDAMFSASPVLIHDKIYAVDETGVVWVIATDPTQLRVLAKNDLGEPSRSTPAISGGRMFVRTYSHLFSIGSGRSEIGGQ